MPTKTIQPEAIALLHHAQINNNLVTFPQVAYETYAKVKPVMVALNAPWNRGKQAHVFAEDVDPFALIQQILISGKMPDQNPLAFFPTSAETAKEMLKQLKRLLPIFPFCRTLEPSAGDGAIADEILSFLVNSKDLNEQSEAYLQLIELDFSRFSKLKQKGYTVLQGDFLAMLPERLQPVFQAIAMNPPFVVAGKPKAYIDHIAHAYAFWLESGGVLVAIAPAGFAQNQDRKTSQFRELVESVGDWKYLEDDTFKHAGTGVKTIMLWMKKPE